MNGTTRTAGVRAHIALLAAAILVPMVAVTAVSLTLLLRAEREAAERRVQETARTIAAKVDAELESAETAMRVLASSPHLAAGDFSAFHQQALAARTDDKAWVVLFDADAMQLLNTRFPGAPRVRRVNPERVDQVIRTQKPSISNVYGASRTGEPLVTVDVPVPVGEGRRYVLSQAFLARHFEESLAGVPLPEGWSASIFDGDGKTLSRNLRTGESAGPPVRPELLQAARARSEGMLQARVDGIGVYEFFARSSRSPWAVAIGVPAQVLEAPARRAVLTAVAGLVAAVAVAGVLALLFSRRLTASIDRAARSAAALGRGERLGPQSSSVTEVDRLHAALEEASVLLDLEKLGRVRAEDERRKLLLSEQDARQLAEAQNRAKDEFLAMLGHELRNPLNAIAGAIALLESPKATPAVEEHARDVVSRQSRHLSRLVDDLLDVSRVMTGKVPLDRSRVDLAVVVDRCVRTLRATGRVGGRNIDVTTESCWVDADATRLEQVVNNLLVNAVKYTPESGRIRISVAPHGTHSVLTISDDGVGIPAELLPRVFDIFVQGAASLDRGDGGLGIGLALVRTLVRMHGGSIEASSAGAGKGSAFTMRLPRAEAPEAPAPRAAEASPGEGRSVLLIDDHEDGRSMLRMMLEMLGHRVVEAADGHEGLRLARETLPEVAIVDIGLPGMNGYEVARELRSHAATRGMRLLALTGYGQAEDRARALAAGFDEHLVKPVDPALLSAAIAAARPAGTAL